MIFTLTLNPCIDHYITLGSLNCGKTNRADKSRVRFGGKGINVSMALHNLGIESKALYFAGGFTGDGLTAYLDSAGIANEFIKTEAETRINTKILSADAETEINAPGGPVSREELNAFIKLLSQIKRGDTVILSGSAPRCEYDAVGEILEAIGKSGARLIADMHGADLKKCLSHYPYLIKPNLEEAAGSLGCEPDPDNAEICAKELSRYADNVILSLGALGAVICFDGMTGRIPVKNPGYKVKSAVGSGDSMIAGFLYGEMHGQSRRICAVAAGSAAAYSEGLVEFELFEEIKSLYGVI